MPDVAQESARAAAWPTGQPDHDLRLLARQSVEIGPDVSTTRTRVCAGLQAHSGIGVICLKHYSTWSLATRSVDDRAVWHACETVDQARVAVSDRVEMLAISGEKSKTIDPTRVVVGSLLRQLDPLPHLPVVESISTRPVWSGGRWTGDDQGYYDPDIRVITCLDKVGLEAQALLRALEPLDDPEQLQARAVEAVEVLGRVCEGADWLAPCDKAAWLTATIAASTRLLWASRTGSPSPMLLIRSPDSGQGGGKSTLAHAVGLIAGGTATLSTEGVDAGEIQRQLAPLLSERCPVIVCDEIGSLKEAGVIETYWHEVLTARAISVRLVGTSTRSVAENHSCFVATGIEPSYRGNTRRRVVPARLAGPADPAGQLARHGLDPLAYCRAHAAELWAACATVVWAYQRAGEPKVECSSARPSYEDWDLVRRAVVWAGGGDCFARPAEEAEDDQALAAGSLLLEQTREALAAIGNDHATYRELARHVGGRPDNRGDAMRLAREVRRSAWPSGWRVVTRTISGSVRYYVERQFDGGAWVTWQPGDPTGDEAEPEAGLEPGPSSPTLVPPPATAPAHITLDHTLDVSVGAGRSDRSTADPTRRSTTIREILEQTGVEVDHKAAIYVCPGVLSSAKPGPDAKPYPRRISELDQAEMLGFDFDEGTPAQLEQLLADLSARGVAHLVHTTYSHAPESPRIRLILIPNRPLDSREYRATWEHLADAFERDLGLEADRSPSHIASVLYLGQPLDSHLPDAPVPWAEDWPRRLAETRGSLWRDGSPVAALSPPKPKREPLVPVDANGPRRGPSRAKRAAAYLAKTPATEHSCDFYKLVCRVGDIAGSEDELRQAIHDWAARVHPCHSTGEVYSERDFAKRIDDAIRYRQETIGCEP